jgi:hypothetical protein
MNSLVCFDNNESLDASPIAAASPALEQNEIASRIARFLNRKPQVRAATPFIAMQSKLEDIATQDAHKVALLTERLVQSTKEEGESFGSMAAKMAEASDKSRALLAAIASDLSLAQQEKDKLAAMHQRLELLLHSSTQDHAYFRQQFESELHAQRNLQGEIDKLEASFQKAQTELCFLHKHMNLLQKELVQSKDALVTLASQADELQKSLSDIESCIQDLKDRRSRCGWFLTAIAVAAIGIGLFMLAPAGVGVGIAAGDEIAIGFVLSGQGASLTLTTMGGAAAGGVLLATLKSNESTPKHAHRPAKDVPPEEEPSLAARASFQPSPMLPKIRMAESTSISNQAQNKTLEAKPLAPPDGNTGDSLMGYIAKDMVGAYVLKKMTGIRTSNQTLRQQHSPKMSTLKHTRGEIVYGMLTPDKQNHSIPQDRLQASEAFNFSKYNEYIESPEYFGKENQLEMVAQVGGAADMVNLTSELLQLIAYPFIEGAKHAGQVIKETCNSHPHLHTQCNRVASAYNAAEDFAIDAAMQAKDYAIAKGSEAFHAICNVHPHMHAECQKIADFSKAMPDGVKAWWNERQRAIEFRAEENYAQFGIPKELTRKFYEDGEEVVATAIISGALKAGGSTARSMLKGKKKITPLQGEILAPTDPRGIFAKDITPQLLLLPGGKR